MCTPSRQVTAAAGSEAGFAAFLAISARTVPRRAMAMQSLFRAFLRRSDAALLDMAPAA
jgi:hypothetical protein